MNINIIRGRLLSRIWPLVSLHLVATQTQRITAFNFINSFSLARQKTLYVASTEKLPCPHLYKNFVPTKHRQACKVTRSSDFFSIYSSFACTGIIFDCLCIFGSCIDCLKPTQHFFYNSLGRRGWCTHDVSPKWSLGAPQRLNFSSALIV